MTYDKLKQLAANMDEAEMHDTLVSLLCDTRFVAVVKLLASHREQFVQAGCQQSIAGHHGPLAHCQGSVYALQTLEGVLRQLAQPPKKRGAQAPATPPAK